MSEPQPPSAPQPAAESLAMIETLVGFDTTSHKSNMALIDYVADHLGGLGIDVDIIRDRQQNKANLLATIGPADRPGVVLSGHSDVVPVTGQNWTSDPFVVRRADDYLYGRGTADMKSFIAVALAAVPRFQAAGLVAPIHLAISYDEEIGCVGVHSLIDQLAAFPVRPFACIVGEPTGMQVVRAHKGKIAIRGVVTGRAAHSSQAHKGANAVEGAARIITRLAEMASAMRRDGPYVADMDPPFATLQTGLIEGGVALNIVPGHCAFEFEIRYLPDQDVDVILAEIKEFAAREVLTDLRKLAPEADISWQETSHIIALDTDEDSPAVALAKSLTGVNATAKVAFGTEGGLFQAIEIPTVVCGPGHVDQAHKPDEYVAMEQVARCETFMARLAARLAAGPLGDRR